MKNKIYFTIIALLLLAIYLRSFSLSRGFLGDEAVTMSSASEQLSGVIPSLVKNDVNPPLTSLLLNFWMKISINEVFIRFYFIIFGIGVLLMIYFIARECFNEKIALLALSLGVISPMLISLSQFVRNYIDSAFWMLLSNYFLLLIIKDKDKKSVWFGYILSALMSIYNFYFSLVIVFCQSIYIFIFKLRNRTMIKKWLVSQFFIGLLFLPWLKYLIQQFSQKNSSILLHWEKFGLKLVGMDIGIYVRNISSLFGMDYFFMVYPEGIKNHFGILMLLVMSCLVFGLAGSFLFFTIKWLRNEFRCDQKIIWFLPFFSLVPLFFSWVSAKILKTLPNARYLAAPHAIFIILIAYFLHVLLRRYKKFGAVSLCAITFLYILRIPMAVTPIYEGKKTLEYLQTHIQEGDCIVMVDRLPGREKLMAPSFNIEKDLYTRDSSTSEYHMLSDANTNKIKDEILGFRRIWFIRAYGNTEILGGNKIVCDFLAKYGKKEVLSKQFNNIKLILFK